MGEMIWECYSCGAIVCGSDHVCIKDGALGLGWRREPTLHIRTLTEPVKDKALEDMLNVAAL